LPALPSLVSLAESGVDGSKVPLTLVECRKVLASAEVTVVSRTRALARVFYFAEIGEGWQRAVADLLEPTGTNGEG
jgi:hypothetical protein